MIITFPDVSYYTGIDTSTKKQENGNYITLYINTFTV